MKNKDVNNKTVYLPPSPACCPLGCPYLRLGGRNGYKCAKLKRSMEVRSDGIPLRLGGCTYKREAA